MARKITQDLIVRITGDGWNYAQARLLIDDANNAAVFSAKSSPSKTFEIADFDLRRGRITTADGDTITFRRRGSSCSWALAKCQVKSLAEYWPETDVIVSDGTSDEPHELETTPIDDDVEITGPIQTLSAEGDDTRSDA